MSALETVAWRVPGVEDDFIIHSADLAAEATSRGFDIEPLTPLAPAQEWEARALAAEERVRVLEGRDERLEWFLRVIEGAGGSLDAGDFHSPCGVFCEDRGEDSDDTYTLADDRGLTTTMHSGWGDGCATVSITDAGRAYLAALLPRQPGATDD